MPADNRFRVVIVPTTLIKAGMEEDSIMMAVGLTVHPLSTRSAS
jgi:hypothetical protein